MNLLNGTFPLVSVAIVTYMQNDFLRECIESVLSQDYPNFEIVVADDGSTDGTQEMLLEYESAYPGKFKLSLSPENQGITSNSNAALNLCIGRYIAWMGGDDLMLPEKLSKQVCFMEENPDCGICYHDLEVFDNDTGKAVLWSEIRRTLEGSAKVLIENECFNGACSNMVRRDLSPSQFNSGIVIASDWLYWVETLINGGEIRYLPYVLGRHRRHANNVTGSVYKAKQLYLDHIASCGFILAKKPGFYASVLKGLGVRLWGARHALDGYLRLVTLSLLLGYGIKPVLALVAFFATFGRVRL